jgi:hypothetical protein
MFAITVAGSIGALKNSVKSVWGWAWLSPSTGSVPTIRGSGTLRNVLRKSLASPAPPALPFSPAATSTL